MRLIAPVQAPVIDLKDVTGKPLIIGGGKPTLVAFFRDAACPFCNVRIYELTRRYDELAAKGLNIVAIFASPEEAVCGFIMQRPRPFAIVADPEKTSYGAYGIGSSLAGKLKAILTRVPTLLQGLRMVGLAGLNTNNVMPADFLITPEGVVSYTYYGEDAGDRLSFDVIEQFLAKYKSVR